MPGGDGTGPRGRGPLTGRGLGPCVEYPHINPHSPQFGRGYGEGHGRRFWRPNKD